MRRTAPVAKAITESRTHIVEGREACKEERDVQDGEMRDVKEGSMKSFDAPDSKGKSMAILGDRW